MLNASKHGSRLPLDELVFADQIKRIAQVTKEDCETGSQVADLANCNIDFERNEVFLQNFNEKPL